MSRTIPLLLLLCAAPIQASEPVPPALEIGLEEAITRFREDAPVNQQLVARAAEARAVVHLASAPLKPILASQGSYTRNDSEVIISLTDVVTKLSESFPVPVELDTSSLPGDLIIQPLEQWTVGATLQVPLVVPSAWADLQAAKKAAKATELTVEAMRRQAEAALIKGSWMSAAAEEVVDSANRSVTAAEAHLHAAEARRDMGLGTELEVLQAKTELASRQSEQLQAVADLDRARRTIGALLGVGEPVRVRVPALAEDGMSGADAAARAKVAQPELAAAEARWEASRKQTASAWWRHAPTLSASAQGAFSDVAFPSGETHAWKLGLQLTWILYDGGARYGLLDKARAQQAQAEAAMRQATLEADQKARDAAEGVAVARGRLRLAEQAQRTATSAEGTASRLYDVGLATSLDVIDAQQRRRQVDVGHAGAMAQVGVALADLALATGGEWSTH